MDYYHMIPLTRKTNSLSPLSRKRALTNNSYSSSKNRNYTTKTTSLNTHNYYNIENISNKSDEFNFKFNNLLKEKNIVIQKLQNQINKSMYKLKEKNQKLKVQQNIIDSLKEQINQLKEELSTKNLMLKQNRNIENKIFQLQKEYLDDHNNSGNSIIYLESIKEYMNKLMSKEEEITGYKQKIKFLSMKLKEKENEIIKKNDLLKKYIMFTREGYTNLQTNSNYNENYENISHSTGKKAKSLKNQNFSKMSSSIVNSNYHLKDSSEKEDIKHINLHTNKYLTESSESINIKRQNSNLKNNYRKLLDNYNDLKKKHNYYYKLCHNFKIKINALNEEKKALMKNINILTIKNTNLTKALSKNNYVGNKLISFTNINNEKENEETDKSTRTQNKTKINNTVSNINTNNNNLLLLLNNKNALNQNSNLNMSNNDFYFNEKDAQAYQNNNNIQQMKFNLLKNKQNNKKTSDLISDDEKDDSNGKNNNNGIPSKNEITNKATKKLYDAFEKYRELYYKKEKENQLLKAKIEENTKIIKEKDLKLKENEKNIESQNNLNMKLTEYFTMIDELETANKKSNNTIKEKENTINENKKEIDKLNNTIKDMKNNYIKEKKSLEQKIKNLELDLEENKKLKKNLLNSIENLNNELHDKEYKIKKLITDIKDKEISIKEEQINTLIKSSNSSELKNDDFTKRITDLQGFVTGMKKEIEKDKKEINKLIDENNMYKSKSNELKIKVEKLEQEKNNLLNNNNKKLKDLEDENDEKNNQIEELVKKINDQEIQYKGMKYDNQELIIGTKQCINDMRQKENKIKKLTNENESLKKNNKELNEKVIELNKKTQNLMNNNQLFNEEKNKLINNCNDLKKENDNKTKEIKEKTDNIEYLNSILLQKTEIIDKLQKSTDELTKELDKIKLELKQKQNDIKQLEGHYNKLKNNNFSVEIVDLIDENNKLILEKQNIENKLEETENDMKTKINQFTKENEILQNKIDKLSNENVKYNKQINEINTKYYEIKKLILDKDKELNNMKEASKAILEKHKKMIEENEKVDPASCRIITNKKYKKLTWYLVRKNTNVNNININTNINNIYNNYFWVNGNILTKEQLKKFNKFEDDEQKQKDLQDYIFDLQKKLERKEESISRLDYKNKKLTEQIQNKTTFANKMKFNIGKNNMINNSNYNYSMNINGSLGDKGFESERFKNILQQLNNSNIRETKLQNEVIELKQKLKKKEEFEAGIPKTCKEIEPYGNDSGFLDDDIKEKEKNCIMDLVKMPTDDKINNKQSGIIGKQPSQTNLSSINGIRENEKKVDLFLKNYVCEDEDQDEIKQMREQIAFLKNRIKEIEIKYKNLEDLVKELIKNVKYEPIIKPQIVQICQVLGYSPRTSQKIISSKISGLKNINL